MCLQLKAISFYKAALKKSGHKGQSRLITGLSKATYYTFMNAVDVCILECIYTCCTYTHVYIQYTRIRTGLLKWKKKYNSLLQVDAIWSRFEAMHLGFVNGLLKLGSSKGCKSHHGGAGGIDFQPDGGGEGEEDPPSSRARGGCSNSRRSLKQRKDLWCDTF